MSTGNFFTSSSFIPMQDRCENTDQKSKDNEHSSEKGRGYIRSIASLSEIAYPTFKGTLHLIILQTLWEHYF